MQEPDVRLWIEPLNERENQILSLISQGLSNREIAHDLSLSLDTVKWYNKQLFSKLGVGSRTQAVAAARQYGLLPDQSPAPPIEVPRSQHNLPNIPTSFIGRQKELAEITRLLRDSRLVVLTGAGGSGKTRLALRVAAQLADRFPDGVWLVELAPLSDPQLVPNAIAGVLGVSQHGETLLVENIKHFLRPRRLLLVLDNFEHLLDASPLVGELVASAPQIVILATSRERLHVYGEHEVPVQPLGLPETGESTSMEDLMRCESVSLFVDRARAVRQDFTLQNGEIAALARICVQLDGLPLALELAASRVKMFSLQALSDRLADRSSLLTGGARDLPERQRALRATIDWSYDLLDPAERSLFARLAIFRSGGVLEAIESICGQDLPGDLLSMLASLVDKSLVRVNRGANGELRYGMLETIRQYALERLEMDAVFNELSRLHARYYAALAETAAGQIRGRNQQYWFARLHNEYDNLRTAMTWSLSSAETVPGLQLAAALRDYWYYTGSNNEHQFWTELAMERMSGAPLALQASVMVSASLLYATRKDQSRGRDLLNQSVSIYAQLGDERQVAWSEMFLSTMLFSQPEEQTLGISLCQESLEIFRRIQDQAGQAQALNVLGEYTRLRRELEESKRYYEQCLELVKKTGERMREGMLYENLGFIAYQQGEYRKALLLMRDFLKIQEEFKNDYGLLTGIASLSGPLAALGLPERAAQLLSATEAHLEAKGGGHQASDLPEIDEYMQAIRELLGESAFQTAWEEGSRMTFQQMLALVFEEVP